MSVPGITVRDLWHFYSLEPVLREISFMVEPGENVAIMGPNGIGKSTLLSLLAWAQRPTKGTIHFGHTERGSSVEAEMEIRRSVYYLPAKSEPVYGLTVGDFLYRIGRVYGGEPVGIWRHGKELLRVFDLAALERQDLGELSTGQLQKVMLCGALISAAPVLLLDEPLGGGMDPSGIAAARSILNHMRETRSHTVVMASPVPEHIEDIASRVLVLRDSAMAAYDTPAKLMASTDPPSRNLAEAYTRIAAPGSLSATEDYLEHMEEFERR